MKITIMDTYFPLLDVYPRPSSLRVSAVSASSAALSWVPGNSNYQHSILLNGREVKLVKPGVYKHTLTGKTFHNLNFQIIVRISSFILYADLSSSSFILRLNIRGYWMEKFNIRC